LRILFLESNPMWIYGLPNGFIDIGHEVKVSGPISENTIPNMIKNFKPHLIITMGWTSENDNSTKVNWMRKHIKAAKIPHVYWSTEDPTHTYRFSLPLIQLLQPDFIFTICQQRVEFYKKLGIKAAHMDFGYHPFVHHPETPQEEYRCSIAVVANGYPGNLTIFPKHYRIQSINTLIAPLVNEGIRIDFFGKGWDNMEKFIGKPIPDEWIHGYLPYNNANKVYSSADIVLGLQNHQTQLTQRTYEILGSGGFLITSDTSEIRHLFTPNKDLVVSASPEETLNLVKYYLNTKDAREHIRENGISAVKPFHYMNRAQYMLDVLRKERLYRITI